MRHPATVSAEQHAPRSLLPDAFDHTGREGTFGAVSMKRARTQPHQASAAAADPQVALAILEYKPQRIVGKSVRHGELLRRSFLGNPVQAGFIRRRPEDAIFVLEQTPDIDDPLSQFLRLDDAAGLHLENL